MTRKTAQNRMLALALGALLAGAGLARADDATAARDLTPGAQKAVERGLAFLAANQDVNQGSVSGKEFRVASTSLAGLAFLASGDAYDRGRYGFAIHEAVRFILSTRKSVEHRPDLCYFADGPNAQGKMHAHGFAILFLAEAYGHATPELDKAIWGAIHGAVAASLEAQTARGGWGYSFRFERDWNEEDEGSVTVTQVQALRAARNIGIYVPADAIGRALAYLKRSMRKDGAVQYSLSMGDPGERSRASYELTAAAVSTLNASGVYLGAAGDAGDELKRGLDYMRRELKKAKTPWAAASDFQFYGNFYAAQAMFQAEPGDWDAWFPPICQELVEKQLTDGSWKTERNFGECYTTASALLILELPKKLLPIFQK